MTRGGCLANLVALIVCCIGWYTVFDWIFG